MKRYNENFHTKHSVFTAPDEHRKRKEGREKKRKEKEKGGEGGRQRRRNKEENKYGGGTCEGTGEKEGRKSESCGMEM